MKPRIEEFKISKNNKIKKSDFKMQITKEYFFNNLVYLI